MNLIKPVKLKFGDTIGIIALSGAVEEKDNILRAQKYFEQKGYKVVLSKNIFEQNRYLAGSDEQKIDELHSFFKNPEIKLILCARGGYGAIRLINKIDYEIIRQNPKIFAGYSDATALLAMILKRSGLITFHAPMAQGDFGSEDFSKFTEDAFFNVVSKGFELNIKPDIDKLKIYQQGDAKGLLWGGNLSTLVSLCGQDFVPEEKFILFIEDLNEPVYKIDKMLTQLFNINEFQQNISGILLGDFLNIDNDRYFDDLFFELAKKFKTPILGGFKITHVAEKLTLPYGSSAYFSTKNQVITAHDYIN